MANENRLIYANALMDAFRSYMVERYDKEKCVSEENCKTCENSCLWRKKVSEALTVDAVEVIHAEWLDIRFDSMWRSMLATCSHCKVRGEVRVKRNECGFAVPDSDYCPNCGAKMDGDGNG